jgi:hypothetical protein
MYGVYSACDRGDYYSAGLNSFSVAVQAYQLRLIRSGWRDQVNKTGTATQTLERADMLLTGFYFACGFDLSIGEDFTDGAKRFGDGSALEQLKANPSDWTGAAATSYTDDVKQLQTLMSDMESADTQMASILSDQMDSLTKRRNIIDTARKVIDVSMPIALAYYANPVEGPEFSEFYQRSVFLTTTTTAIAELGVQLAQCKDNAARVDTQTRKYRDVQTRADALYARISTTALTSSSPLIRSVEGDQMPNDVWLWFAHGPVCGQTSLAAHAAEKARIAAGDAIGKVAVRLADNLKHAKLAYTTTDEHQKDILGQQMQ